MKSNEIRGPTGKFYENWVTRIRAQPLLISLQRTPTLKMSKVISLTSLLIRTLKKGENGNAYYLELAKCIEGAWHQSRS